MKTAISISDSIFHKADALAKQLGVSRSELYARAVSELLARHDSDQVRARLDLVYEASDARAEPTPAAAQHRSVPRADQW
jgi:metal-responsive CopG/Arc/MetJ family transcriptional regulator